MTFVRLLIALSAVVELVERVAGRFGDWLGDLWDAFPNAAEMVEVTIRFVTGIIGEALASVLTIRWSLAAEQVGQECKGKLMSPKDSILFIKDCMENAIQKVTMTEEQTVFEWFTQKLGLFVFNLVKRFSTVLSILQIQAAADVVAIFRKYFVFKVTILLTMVMMAFVALLVAIAGEVVATLVLLQAENARNFCLPQDSKFVSTKHKHRRRRDNLRAGTDAT